MTPGSNPLPPLASPTASVPADLPHLVSRDTLSQSISRALNQPVRVVEMDDGDGRTLIVEPLHFHRVVRRKGRDVVCKSHVTPNSEAPQHDPVA